jgi:hypothetical protein
MNTSMHMQMRMHLRSEIGARHVAQTLVGLIVRVGEQRLPACGKGNGKYRVYKFEVCLIQKKVL